MPQSLHWALSWSIDPDSTLSFTSRTVVLNGHSAYHHFACCGSRRTSGSTARAHTCDVAGTAISLLKTKYLVACKACLGPGEATCNSKCKSNLVNQCGGDASPCEVYHPAWMPPNCQCRQKPSSNLSRHWALICRPSWMWHFSKGPPVAIARL